MGAVEERRFFHRKEHAKNSGNYCKKKRAINPGKPHLQVTESCGSAGRCYRRDMTEISTITLYVNGCQIQSSSFSVKTRLEKTESRATENDSNRRSPG